MGRFNNYYKVTRKLGRVRKMTLEMCQYQSNGLHKITYAFKIIQNNLGKKCQSR